MENENNNTTETMSADEYIKQLTELKNNTVSKDEYSKLEAENAKLANALVNGLKQEEEPQGIPYETLVKMASEPANDLELFTGLLGIRQTYIEQGKRDPFLPTARNYTPTQADIDECERYANVLQQCIDEADGDPVVFSQTLSRKCGGYKK